MPRSRSPLIAVLAFAVWGCAAPPPKPVESVDPFAPPAEPVVTRVAVAPERSIEALKDATRLLREGQFAQADANLEEVRRVRPDIPEVHFNLGWAKLQRRKYPEAVAHLMEGLKLRPAEIRAYALAGIAYREQGRFADAEKAYLDGLALAPDDDRLHFNLGVLYDLYLLDPAKALEHYQTFQKLQTKPDTRVAGWIALLERDAKRREAAQSTPEPSPAPDNLPPPEKPTSGGPAKPLGVPVPAKSTKGSAK
jgi:Flp pilus assembly protein TadD